MKCKSCKKCEDVSCIEDNEYFNQDILNWKISPTCKQNACLRVAQSKRNLNQKMQSDFKKYIKTILIQNLALHVKTMLNLYDFIHFCIIVNFGIFKFVASF